MRWIRPRRPAGGVAEGGVSNRRRLGLGLRLVLGLVAMLGLRLGLRLVPLMPGC